MLGVGMRKRRKRKKRKIKGHLRAKSRLLDEQPWEWQKSHFQWSSRPLLGPIRGCQKLETPDSLESKIQLLWGHKICRNPKSCPLFISLSLSTFFWTLKKNISNATSTTYCVTLPNYLDSHSCDVFIWKIGVIKSTPTSQSCSTRPRWCRLTA